MGRRIPGEVVYRTARGVRVEYAPHSGSTRKYKVRCPHGEFVYDRTVADAREDAASVSEWCADCRIEEEGEGE